MRACACLALGAASGLGLATNLEDAAAIPPGIFPATIEARVGSVFAQPDRVVVELDSERAIEPSPQLAPPRLLLTSYADPGSGPPATAALVPGDRIRAHVRIRPLEARANPGGPDRERQAARRGFGARATLIHEDLLVRRPDAEGVRPLVPLHRLRARASQRLAREDRGGGLVRALALGDRGGLATETRDAWQRLGVSHLLAVSGLHLALTAVVVYRILSALLLRAGRPAWRADPRTAALLGAAGAAVGYALLAGFGVPVRRALVVLLGLAASVAMRRPTRRGAPLLAAAIVILAFEPAALFEVGAWLSFSASAALVWAVHAPALDRDVGSSVYARMRRSIADTVGTTALASAATAPITAGTLGLGAPGYGVLTNLVAIPWTALVLLPASIPAALVAGLVPESAPAAWLCAAVAGLGTLTLDASTAVAALAPVLPATPRGPWAIAAASGAALCAIRARSVVGRLAASLVVAGVLSVAPPPRIDPSPPRVVVLDESRMR
jgi:competence protein ComEC